MVKSSTLSEYQTHELDTASDHELNTTSEHVLGTASAEELETASDSESDVDTLAAKLDSLKVVGSGETPMKKAREPRALYLVHSRKELRPYHPFPKIYGEMKYTRKFRKQSVSFLDLPAELRIKVYRNAFVFEEPLEFWEHSDSPHHSFWIREDTKKWLLRLIKYRRLNLGFLRTCRTVQTEGAQVFYGENEFRFTGINGHMVANLFIRKIYKQHFQFITKLTIPMPFCTQSRNHPWSSCKRTYNDIVPSLPSRGWVDKHFEYEDAFGHLVWNLNCIENFSKLVLVLQRDDDVDMDEQGRDSKAWTALRELAKEKPELEIEIVRMFPEYYHNKLVSATEWFEALDIKENHAWLIDNIKSFVKKCTVKGAFEHRRGRWHIVGDRPEDALVPEQEEDTDSE